MEKAGIYVHIPFCVKKCLYCDFASFADQWDRMEAYTQKLCEEIENCPFDICVDSLYIGGGTPSAIRVDFLRQILNVLEKRFSFGECREKSCEMNPGTVTEEFVSLLKTHGFTRASIGLQSANTWILAELGRIHSPQDALQTANLLKQYGITDFNVDIMLGVPGQTLQDVRETLAFVLSLSPKHVSCYGLILEEGTPLYLAVQEGKKGLPDVETEREMYDLCIRTLSQHGFEQYEISNFAQPGFRCRHNMHVWKRGAYLGFGLSAAGFYRGVRRQNPCTMEKYLSGAPPEETVVTPEDACFESVMLGLRLMEGIREEEFYQMHGISLRDYLGTRVQKPMREGLLCYENGVCKLTRKGMDLQNRVLVDLMP